MHNTREDARDSQWEVSVGEQSQTLNIWENAGIPSFYTLWFIIHKC